jgi:hypothetical protein
VNHHENLDPTRPDHAKTGTVDHHETVIKILIHTRLDQTERAPWITLGTWYLGDG